jgi:membrane-bound ClpP family serine protease
MTTFKSKIGIEFVLPIVLVLGFVLFMGLTSGPVWAAVLISGILFLLIGYMFLSTKYIVQDHFLIIQVRFFYRKKIDVLTIRKIKPSRNPLSSPATSIDRLEIRHGQYGFELISPKDKTGFVQALMAINPEIQIEGMNVQP